MKKIIFLFLLCATISCEKHSDTSKLDRNVPFIPRVENLENSKAEDKVEEEGSSSFLMLSCLLLSGLSLVVSITAFVRTGKKKKKNDNIGYIPKQKENHTTDELHKEITNLQIKLKRIEGQIQNPVTPTQPSHVTSLIIQQPKPEKKKEAEVEVFYLPTGSDGRFRDKLTSQTGEAIFRVTQKDKDHITFEPVNFERIRTMGGNKDSVIELERGSCSWMEAKGMQKVTPGTLRYSSTSEGTSFWKVKTKIKLILIK